MSTVDLVVPVRTAADLTGLDAFVRRLHLWSRRNLPGGWTITLAVADGLPTTYATQLVQRLPGVWAIGVPAWGSPGQRYRTLTSLAPHPVVIGTDALDIAGTLAEPVADALAPRYRVLAA